MANDFVNNFAEEEEKEEEEEEEAQYEESESDDFTDQSEDLIQVGVNWNSLSRDEKKGVLKKQRYEKRLEIRMNLKTLRKQEKSEIRDANRLVRIDERTKLRQRFQFC